jgi:murein DD-endopeptidase MepM/ murein hydrolase activator NlpD
MGRRFALVFVFALALAAPASAGDIGSQKARVDGRIANLEKQIEVAKTHEGVLTSQLSVVASELRTAQGAVDEAQQDLDQLEWQLSHERSRLERLSRLLRVRTARLRRLQADYRLAVGVLEARVRAIYMANSPDLLSFLVSASSFGDLVDNYEFLRRIGLQDERIATRVANAKAKAAEERETTARTRALAAASVSVIAARTEEARSIRDHLVASRDSLLAARRLKANALRNLRQSRSDYLAEAKALEAQSAALGERIRAAQSQQGSTGSTVSSSGFIWPVQGPVTSGFGMRWGQMHEGIDIAVPVGTPVRASAAGRVIYAGWTSGYGNLVVIDHGNGLATAYAHNSTLLVRQAELVAQGQVISLSGSTGHSTGPHVHFEVRLNGAPVDPLLYL